MGFKTIKTVCFTVCIVSIIIGLLLGLAMIWGIVKDSDFAWKCFMTLGLFFFASSATLSVVRYLGYRDGA